MKKLHCLLLILGFWQLSALADIQTIHAIATGASVATQMLAQPGVLVNSNPQTAPAVPPKMPTVAPLAPTPNPTPTNIDASSGGEIQSIEGIYVFAKDADKMDVRVAVAPKSLAENKTNIMSALEPITVMVCADNNCEFALPNSAGYFEILMKMPETVLLDQPQTHSLPISVAACSYLGCVKSKIQTTIQFLPATS